MSNIVKTITANGIKTLATAGTRCERDIEIRVNVPSSDGKLLFTLQDNTVVSASDVPSLSIPSGEVTKITDSTGLILWLRAVITYIWKKFRIDTVYNWDKYSVTTTYTTYEPYLPTDGETPEELEDYIDSNFGGDEDDWWSEDEPDYDYILDSMPSTTYASRYRSINISTDGTITGGTTSTNSSNVYMYVNKEYSSGDTLLVGWYYVVGKCGSDGYVVYDLIAKASDPEYVKGSKVGSVTSSSSSTYPADGIKGDYWYVKKANTTQKTYIEDVTSTDINAYPSDGKHTDGFWYTKIT